MNNPHRFFKHPFLCTVFLSFSLFSGQVLAHIPLLITSEMLSTTSSSNPEALFDNDMDSFWFVGWNKEDYPAETVIDLGVNYDLTRIDLFDTSGNGDFKVYTGSPGNWTSNPIIIDSLVDYNLWHQNVVSVSTRYLRLEMDTRVARVGELMIYGVAAGGSAVPVITQINPISLVAGSQQTVSVSASDTNSLMTSYLPPFVSYENLGNGLGELVLTPSQQDIGTYNISLTATGLGGSSNASVTINVMPVVSSNGICSIVSAIELNGSGDVGNLFDELNTAGDPAAGNSGEPDGVWFAGWNRDDYPVRGYIDLGSVQQLQNIYWFDLNGDGGFTITAGSPGNWNSTPLVNDSLSLYKKWSNQSVSVNTRYLRFEMLTRASNVAEVVLYGNCGSTIDTTSPADTNNLSVVSSSANSVNLSWTAPGDDANTGTAANYDFRYSPMPISASTFDLSSTISLSSPSTAGSNQTAQIQSLICETEYFFALKTSDEVGNQSGLSNLASVTTGSCGGGNSDITLTLTLDSAPGQAPPVAISALRFNKDFAYSLTIDDGSPMEYNNVFPILNGGTSSNNVSESGFNYSDGCGNQRPFKAGLSLNGGNLSETAGEFYMSWGNIEEIYQADWDIYNHSNTHCAGEGNCDDYNAEVYKNTENIFARLGHTTTHFVVPSADYDGYLSPAFNNGMTAVYDQLWTMPGRYGLQVDEALDLNQFQLHRNTLETEAIPFGEDVINVANLATGGNHYWFSEYAHRIGNPGDWFITVQKDDFKDYMQLIEANYGDRVWMAPLQEVYEYLQVRQNAVITSSSINGNQLTINIDTSAVPEDLRRYALSLQLDSSDLVTGASATGASICTNPDGLINLEW